MNRILLLEDDVSLIDGLVYSLKKRMNLMLKLPVQYVKQNNTYRTRPIRFIDFGCYSARWNRI